LDNNFFTGYEIKRQTNRRIEKRGAKPMIAAETAKRVKVGLLKQLVEEFPKEVLEDRKC
jgi:hypothetical protein